jgi:hypothetical protein
MHGQVKNIDPKTGKDMKKDEDAEYIKQDQEKHQKQLEREQKVTEDDTAEKRVKSIERKVAAGKGKRQPRTEGQAKAMDNAIKEGKASPVKVIKSEVVKFDSNGQWSM